jgi:glycine cleavage system transcriptional repressor
MARGVVVCYHLAPESGRVAMERLRMGSVNAVISAIGADRPGLVDRISALIHEAGGNIEESRMAILGGDFALILLFSGAAASIARVRKGLPAAAKRLGLSCTIKETQPKRRASPVHVFRLKVMGIDHPGIVHRVSAAAAALGVNVASLDTRLEEAPMSGAPVFVMTADLQVPLDLPSGDVRRALEAVCSGEALDFSLEVVS